MRETGSSDLKNELERFVKGYGAYIMRVADASKGFENAVSGCRPKDVMEKCNSVVVFAVYVGPDYYRTLKIETRSLETIESCTFIVTGCNIRYLSTFEKKDTAPLFQLVISTEKS